MTIQVAPDDCTGCGVCVNVCPAKSKEAVKHKAINMEPKEDHLEVERANWDFFKTIPEPDRTLININNVKGSQLLDPLFEFSGACSGCGETPYIKLLTQLFGDRIMVANATGCSSIYGGNLPTTPYARQRRRTGTDLGQLAVRGQRRVRARHATGARSGDWRRPACWWRRCPIRSARTSPPRCSKPTSRTRPASTPSALTWPSWSGSCKTIDDPRARRLEAISGTLVRKSVWIVGGDGWAYDIGFGGVDHAMASGKNVNILVLDTEVYSNTGGQASKATPRGAVAKFAASGKTNAKKDLGQIAMAYDNVYVAQIAMGANNIQTVKAFQEAEAFDGPSLIIAYSTCIAHGIDMETSMEPPEGPGELGVLAAVSLRPAGDRSRANTHSISTVENRPWRLRRWPRTRAALRC